MTTSTIVCADACSALYGLAEESVHTCITSPPYWGLRGYTGEPGMIGLEETWDQHLGNLLNVLTRVRRVLRDDGTLWLNYGDAYVTSDKPRKGLNLGLKQLMNLPARLTIAMQDAGWILRSKIVWHKRNPQPEGGAYDRPTRAYEEVFLFSKYQKYYYDADAVRTPPKLRKYRRPHSWALTSSTTHSPLAHERHKLKMGKPSMWVHNKGVSHDPRQLEDERRRLRKPHERGYKRPHEGFDRNWDLMTKEEQQANGANLRNVWSIAPRGVKGAHFAVFPKELVRIPILAGCPVGGLVLDPFAGSGTVGVVAAELGRNSHLIEISEEYSELARNRIEKVNPLYNTVDYRPF